MTAVLTRPGSIGTTGAVEPEQSPADQTYVTPLQFDSQGNRLPERISPKVVRRIMEVVNNCRCHTDEGDFVFVLLETFIEYGTVVPVPAQDTSDVLGNLSKKAPRIPTSAEIRAIVQAVDAGLEANDQNRMADLCDGQQMSVALDMFWIAGN